MGGGTGIGVRMALFFLPQAGRELRPSFSKFQATCGRASHAYFVVTDASLKYILFALVGPMCTHANKEQNKPIAAWRFHGGIHYLNMEECFTSVGWLPALDSLYIQLM